MRKSEIIRRLKKSQKQLGDVIAEFEIIGTDDQTAKRIAQTKITFTMFELIDGIGEVEVAVYNYLKRKGWK